MYIGAGVIDSKLISQKETSPYDRNIIYYWADGGQVIGNGNGTRKNKRKTILKQGDTISVNVCLRSGFIEWKINGITQEDYSMQKLKDEKI